MKKNDFELRIKSLQCEVNDLLHFDSVPYDSALFAFLQTANVSLVSALAHLNDFNRDKL